MFQHVPWSKRKGQVWCFPYESCPAAQHSVKALTLFAVLTHCTTHRHMSCTLSNQHAMQLSEPSNGQILIAHSQLGRCLSQVQLFYLTNLFTPWQSYGAAWWRRWCPEGSFRQGGCPGYCAVRTFQTIQEVWWRGICFVLSPPLSVCRCALVHPGNYRMWQAMIAVRLVFRTHYLQVVAVIVQRIVGKRWLMWTHNGPSCCLSGW